MIIRKIQKDDAVNLLKYFNTLVNVDPERVERAEDVAKITLDNEVKWIENQLSKEDNKEIFLLCGLDDNGDIVAEGEVEKLPRWIERHVAEIRFAVLPENNLVAETLIQELFEKAKNNGIEVLLYFHLETQKRGIEIMEKLGFEKMGVVEKYYKRNGDYIGRIYMVKNL